MERGRHVGVVAVVGALGLAWGCGGKAVVDGTSAGGSGGGTTSTTSSHVTTTTTSTSTSTTTTGTAPCTSHADCADGVCVFATGLCAPSCVAESCDGCGPGRYCEPCATSSCPECFDCMAACMPATAGRCDVDDPCPGVQLCQWVWGACLMPCGPNGDCGGWSYCDECATSSACGDDDCVAACMGGE